MALYPCIYGLHQLKLLKKDMKLGEDMMREYGENWKGKSRLDMVIFYSIHVSTFQSKKKILRKNTNGQEILGEYSIP